MLKGARYPAGIYMGDISLADELATACTWPVPSLPYRALCPSAFPENNIARFTRRFVALGFWYWYDEATRYALRYSRFGMLHPQPGQRNGRPPGVSKEGTIDMKTVATWPVFHFSIHDRGTTGRWKHTSPCSSLV